MSFIIPDIDLRMSIEEADFAAGFMVSGIGMPCPFATTAAASKTQMVNACSPRLDSAQLMQDLIAARMVSPCFMLSPFNSFEVEKTIGTRSPASASEIRLTMPNTEES